MTDTILRTTSADVQAALVAFHQKTSDNAIDPVRASGGVWLPVLQDGFALEFAIKQQNPGSSSLEKVQKAQSQAGGANDKGFLVTAAKICLAEMTTNFRTVFPLTMFENEAGIDTHTMGVEVLVAEGLDRNLISVRNDSTTDEPSHLVVDRTLAWSSVNAEGEAVTTYYHYDRSSFPLIVAKMGVTPFIPILNAATSAENFKKSSSLVAVRG
jgi:hypothetical protein